MTERQGEYRSSKAWFFVPFFFGILDCIYSHVVQKDPESGVLNVFVAQDGRILKQASMAADYGVVSIAGNCA